MIENENISELIMEFADGSLAPEMEDKLFMQLSNNEELKTEFKNHMAIKSAIRSSASSVVLPYSSKSAVFTTLGLSIPTNLGAPLGFADKFGHFFQSHWKVLVTSVASVLFTLGVIYLSDNFTGNDKSGLAQSKLNQNQYGNQEINQNINQIPVISNKEITPKGNNSGNSHPVNLSEKKIDNLVIIDNIDEQSVTQENITFTLNPSSLVGFGNNHVNNNQILNISNNFDGIYENLPFEINESTDDKSLELRGSNYIYDKTASISPKKYSALNNLAVSGLYNLDDNFKIGLDIRQENFLLTYNGFEGDQEYIYKQQPNFTTISALIRYNPVQFGKFLPFTQAQLGLNSVGFVYRGMIGTQYQIYSDIALMIGFEFSNLSFKYQNSQYNSFKYGFNYGIIYNF